MKKLPNKWPNTENGLTVGFFAQIALELVHRESWEGYKLPAMSTAYRLSETRSVARDVMKRILPDKALEPVVAEVNNSIHDDPIFVNILNALSLSPSEVEIVPRDAAQDIFSQAGFLHQICNTKYRKVGEDLLVEECFGKARRSVIFSLLRNYFSELVLRGHSRREIELNVRATFYERSLKLVSRRTLRSFFRKFPHEEQTYRVVGVLDDKFFRPYSRLIGIKRIPASGLPSETVSAISKTKGECYFSLMTEALDPYSAAQIAGLLLKFADSALLLFPGESPGKIPSRLAVSKPKSKEFVIAETHEGLHRRVLSRSRNSPLVHVDRVARLIHKEEPGSGDLLGSSFLRATHMAGVADMSTASEVKLLTLWAAFETLIPDVPEGSTNRISHFLEYIVPAVTICYAHNCFVEFSRDAERLYNKKYTEFLQSVAHGEGSLSERLAFVVISGEESTRSELMSIFDSNPLALFRLNDLHNKFADPDNFKQATTDHRNRVSWQVQRIYRERNAVMHNGQSSPALERLVSNTYYYYLLVFSHIEAASKLYGNLTIAQTMSAIRKISAADTEKLKSARNLFLKGSKVEARSILHQLASGRFK